jgi:hypothetical protein
MQQRLFSTPPTAALLRPNFFWHGDLKVILFSLDVQKDFT